MRRGFFNSPIDHRSHSVPDAAMVTHKNNSLTDLIRNGDWLKLVCECKHEAKLDPVTLRTQLHKMGKSGELHRLNEAMKCQQCGSRNFQAVASLAPDGWS